nr:immunoglobulin light chain junction region [Macaca mulatta]
CQHNFGAPFTF